MLDKTYCKKLMDNKSTKSPLAIMYKIDFMVMSCNYTLDPHCKQHIKNVLGSFEEKKIESYIHLFNNIAATQKIVLKVRKDI